MLALRLQPDPQSLCQHRKNRVWHPHCKSELEHNQKASLVAELYVCDLASDSKHSCSYQMFTNFEVLFPVIFMSLYSTLSFLLRTPEQPAKTTGESRLLFPRKEKLTVLIICIFCCILVSENSETTPRLHKDEV